MHTLVEIGPFHASQVQHRRKDATKQMKNLTLALALHMVIEVGWLWRCLVLLEVTSMSSVLLSLG